MASMYGVEIRSMKTNVVDNEACFRGEVYYKGKYLGTWAQRFNDAPDEINFDINIISEAIEKYKVSLPEDFILLNLINVEFFLDDLAQLNHIEERFKQWIEQGYTTVVKVDNGLGYNLGACNYDKKRDLDKYVRRIAGQMKECKVTFYRILEDFIIE